MDVKTSRFFSKIDYEADDWTCFSYVGLPGPMRMSSDSRMRANRVVLKWTVLSAATGMFMRISFWNNAHSKTSNYYLRQGDYDFVGLCLFVCLSVCKQDNSKSYGQIFLKFWGYVGHGIYYQRLNFGRDPAGILDSGSLWNFRSIALKGA